MKEYEIVTFPTVKSIDWNIVPKADIDNFKWENDFSFAHPFAQMIYIKKKQFIIRLVSKENKPWSNYKKDGDPVYLDSCLEAFLSLDNSSYINFETNSLGVRLQGFGKDRHNRLNVIKEKYNFKVITMNDNKQWEVFVFVKLSKLAELYNNFDFSLIKQGFIMYGNFYKTGQDPITLKSHYGMWNPIDSEKPDFHRPEQFGKLIIK